MKGKVKCTCGWSWNKSDSSKKDMYICHECGRDNSNNIPKAQDGDELLPIPYSNEYLDSLEKDYLKMYNDPNREMDDGYDAFYHSLIDHLPDVIRKTKGWLKYIPGEEEDGTFVEEDAENTTAPLPSKKRMVKRVEDYEISDKPDTSKQVRIAKYIQQRAINKLDKRSVSNNKVYDIDTPKQKNGGWLDQYVDGGTMQEHQENYNNSQASAPEGMVGDGFSNVGRNYSPAWGGQFQEGGEIPMAQKGKKLKQIITNDPADPRLHQYLDSLNLYKAHLAQLKFNPKQDVNKGFAPDMTKKTLKKLNSKMNKDFFSLKGLKAGKDYWEDEKTYNQDNRLTNDPKLINEYKKLSFSTPTTTALWTTPDIYNSKISPTGVYYGGKTADDAAINPIFKNPNQPIIYSGNPKDIEKYRSTPEILGSKIKFNPKEQIQYQDIPQKRQSVKVIKNNLQPQGISSDFSIDAQLPVIRPEARMPKSFDVNSQRQTMSGPSEYYNYSDEGVDFSDALRAKESADTYNQYVKEKYEEAAKTNPKAQKRLEQLMQNVELTPNYQMGGNVYPVNYVPQAQNGKNKKKKGAQDLLRDVENSVNKSLGNPMQKAATAAEQLAGKWYNPKTKQWEENDDVDNFRHPMAGRYTSEAIQDKLYNIPILSQMAGMTGSNALGVAHELSTLFHPKDKRGWYDKIRESGEDIFNNAVGATVGSLPISDKQKTNILTKLSNQNMLPDGVSGKGGDMYIKHAMGGYIPQAQEGIKTYSYPLRDKLYPGEEEYFKANPHVGGMAAEDNQVIINPYSPLSDEEKNAIRMNETARLAMRNGYARPTFELTPEQKEAFKNYSTDEQDQRETIIGRILSGDPSAKNVTPEQKKYAEELQKVLKFQGGGSIPGSVGFTYARTKGIPSNGPYAKKTMASAQNGVDMYDNPLIARMVNNANIDRSYYDPRLNTINMGSDYNMWRDEETGEPLTGEDLKYQQDKMLAHENYHAMQHKEGRDNYDIAHSTDNEQWARMQKRPEVMSTDAVWNNFYNRSAIENIQDYANKINEIPEARLINQQLLFDKVLDRERYNNPSNLEGEAKFYEDTGVTFQNGGEMKYYQEGLDWKPKTISKNGGWLDGYEKAQTGYTTGDKVTYGTPEYTEAYNKGEVVTDEGVRSPIALDEVVIQNNYRRPRGFWEQYADKIVEENKDAGLLGAIIGTPISAITSLPQLAMMKGLTGEMQRPSEAMDIENPYGAFAVDAVTDPANLIGAGILTKEKALAKLAASKESGLLSNAYRLNPNAERLNDINKSYRVAGLDALEDFNNTGVVRSGDGSLHTFKFADLKGNFHQIKRPTGFPSFQKGYADMRYAPEEGAVVFETGLPTFKRGEINPVTGNRIRGRHYAHRVIDPETGKVMTEIPGSNINVYGDKPHWWKGYQQLDLPGRNYFEGPLPIIPRNNMIQSPAIDSALKKELRPYISRIGEPSISREEEVFRNVMGHDYRVAKELENTKFLDPDGNLISNPNISQQQFYQGDIPATDRPIQKDGGIIKDDRGQWDHPGEITEIGSNEITMEGVPYPVLGISDEGDTKLMKPGKNYKFKGKKVTEFPMAKNGLRQEQKGLVNLDNLLNFTNYNKPQPGGWLSKYE